PRHRAGIETWRSAPIPRYGSTAPRLGGGAGRVEPRAGTRSGGVELGDVGDLGVETSEGLLGGDGRGDPMRAGAHRDVPLRVAGEGGIGDDGPGRGRAERGDRAALVASD